MKETLAGMDFAEVERILLDFIRVEIGRSGLSSAILGLSGGLDSSLVAYLGAKALGADKLTGIAMPYKSSSPESLAHARLVAELTGIALIEQEITATVDPYFADKPEASSLRRGNKMARERMSVLYDRSAELGALVLGTSNRSEICLGYGTAFGDLACAVNPIGALYKTEVRLLSRRMGVPAEIVDKAPSADLWAGQSDEEELGFTYEKVDPLLHLMFDRNLSREDLLAGGWEAELVDRVAELYSRNEFKRHMPLIAGVPRDEGAPGSSGTQGQG